MEDEIDSAVSSLDKEMNSQLDNAVNEDKITSDSVKADASHNTDAIMKQLYRASPECIEVRDIREVNDHDPKSVSNLDELYEELDDNDITEIYLGKSETDNAVAALEISNEMGDIVIHPLKEEVDSVKSEVPDSSNDRMKTCDIDSFKVDIKVEKSDSDIGQATLKRRQSGDDKENYQTKRIKLEHNEHAGNNASVTKTGLISKMPSLTKPNEEHCFGSVISSSSGNQRHIASIDLCPPVAIVTPMGLKEELDKDITAVKHVIGNDKELSDLKSDINSILESFDKEEKSEITERLDKANGEEPSIKLTDSEFEQFKNDILADHSFKTLHGGQWNFGNPPQKPSVADSSRRSSVESEIGDFERVLSSFIKRSDSLDQVKAHSEMSSSSNAKPSTKNPYLTKCAKNADKMDPNVVLANSELLRELLEDKPDKDNASQKNRVKPGSVDLSFLDRDLKALKGSRTPVAALLKTKTIEPSFKSGPLLNKTSNGALPDASVTQRESSEMCISIPDEEGKVRENKLEDQGPLSLAEQRRASVTLHHKVPSLTDLMNASGPLNKMNGDETEALLNELVGSPGNDHYRNDFTSPASHITPPDYKSGYPPNVGQTQSGFHNGYRGNGPPHSASSESPMQSQMYAHPESQKQFTVDGGFHPNVPLLKGMPDLSGVDLDSLPPERRQILMSRYGHFLRRRGMTGPILERPGYPRTQHQSLLTPVSMTSNQNSSGFPPDMRGPMPMKNAMIQRQNPTVPYDQFQNKDSLSALLSSTNEQKMPRNNPGSAMPGAMDDRMRNMMMQQLNRRRMISQMQNQPPYQGQTEAGHAQMGGKPLSSMHQNGVARHGTGSPHDMSQLPPRFPGHNLPYAVPGGPANPYQQPGLEGQGHQYMSGLAGTGFQHGRSRMYHQQQGHPAYSRQLGHMPGNHAQPSRTPPHTSMAHAQAGMTHAHNVPSQGNGQAGGHQCHEQYQPMSPLSGPQASYSQHGQSHDANYNRSYQSPDSSFKEPAMNGALGSTGVQITSNPTTAGMPSFGNEQHNFAPQSSDFFM